MEALRINFAARPRFTVNTVGASVLLLAFILAGVVTRIAITQDNRYQEAMAAHQQVTSDSKTRSVPSGAGDQVNLAAIKQASVVLDALSVPWDQLFVSIEATNVEGLGLLTLSPDPRSGNLHISGEGASLDDVLAYVARLGSQSGFRDVNLVSYETVQRDGSGAVQFSLVAKWK